LFLGARNVPAEPAEKKDEDPKTGGPRYSLHMERCLFCESGGPFERVEHIVPEALGNSDLLLRGEVCDACNQYFGKEIEAFVLGKTPIAFWRTFLGIRKKGGGLPHVDLSQPTREKGRLRAVHPLHDNLIGFTCHEDYSVSADIENENIVREIVYGTRRRFTFAFTPLVLAMLGRFLCKVGVELVCLENSIRARSDMFKKARRFARQGEFEGLWPIFHFQSEGVEDLGVRRSDHGSFVEEVLCYRYQLLDVGGKYCLVVLTVGTDTWVVSLDDPYPTPIIRGCFPGRELHLVWYSREEMERP